MSKFDQLKALIETIPAEESLIKSTLLKLLDTGDLSMCLAYVKGAYDMAACLTGDENILVPLNKIWRALK